MVNEPSVLDYFKSIFTFSRGRILKIPGGELEKGTENKSGEVKGASREILDLGVTERLDTAPRIEAEPLPQAVLVSIPWLCFAVLGLALLAQRSLEPNPERTWTIGGVLYLLAAIALVLAIWRGEWVVAPLPSGERRSDPLTVRQIPLWFGIVFIFLAFLTFGGNRFTSLNVSLWLAGLALISSAFWLPGSQPRPGGLRLRVFLDRKQWGLSISRWALLLLGAALLAIFFRVYRLGQVPPEMVSDHAEKLLDVWDVLHGQTSIFFPRNTGREAFQMYLTAAVIQLLGTGYTFLSLKIGTVLGGLLTLPYIYLLGGEVGRRRIGLFAMVFAGIAYWPNVISRIALRFTLYPLFFAPTLYYFLRGLRTSNRNDFILAGLFLGIGLHGYSPFRFVPIVILVGIALYLLHRQSSGRRMQVVFYLILLGLVALVVFLPLLRYALSNPDMFSYRALTRLGIVERPFPGSPLLIFLKNLWNALTMFFWDNGEVWVISVTHRPALDIVSAALFFLGVVYLLTRYVRQRHWLDIFLIVSIPLLMMPSILSLAFPAENPSLNRTAAALVPVFLIVGIALDGLLTTLETHFTSGRGRVFAWGFGILLLFIAAMQNYGLVFTQYQRVYELSSWNSSEMAQVIRSFAESVGDVDSAYVVAYPYWVDTRLIGFSAGYPTKDFALWPEHFVDTLANRRAKLFVIYLQDQTSLDALKSMYPQGQLQLHPSRVETKDFWLFFVPATQGT